MYDYTYDIETGGLLLGERISQLSNEPRPVYAAELNLLGMDKYWRFDQQNETPYMWSEACNYIYRGTKVAKIKGGALCQAPVLELVHTKADDGDATLALPQGTTLLAVDIPAMVERNKDALSIVEQITVKKIYDYYKRYKDKLDCFHVAFSGGKDSVVLLELVKRALPRSSFMVVFGDTGMEFSDTYRIIDQEEAICRKDGIEFHRARSHFDPMDSWRLFGPPSNVLRWCCSVHKSAPQTLKIREVLAKGDYVGADFVGVRAQESVRRADYEYENYGKKQRGQYSLNPLLEWSSAEIWLYIFANALPINDAYKKGNSRAGCLLCPMGGGKADYFRHAAYGKEIDRYTDTIRELIDDKSIDTYVTNGGWISRRNGRDIKDNVSNYIEEVKDGYLYMIIPKPKTSWTEWMKTLADPPTSLYVEQRKEGLVARISAELNKTSIAKQVKQIFHKVAYCGACRVCEANCPYGYISFEGGLHIDDRCVKCGKCRQIEDGCLLYHSLQLPKNGGRVMKSLNTFADHAPKYEWVRDFYERGDEFFQNNSLGPMQISMFKRFLSDAQLAEKNKVTEFMLLTKRIGWESDSAWGLILIQLVYENPQIRWYIDNMPVNERMPRTYLEDLLTETGMSEKDAKSITKAFGRLCGLPLGTALNFGAVEKKGRQITNLTRCKASLRDDRVILYALYRFAEACDGYYQFTLSRLLDESIVSNGICPSRLFGLDSDAVKQIVYGLSAGYPDYLYATFTHDSEKIQLRENKTSQDVLGLFVGQEQ